MVATRRQTASRQVAAGQSRATATFRLPTLAGSLVVVVAASKRGDTVLTAPAGFTSIGAAQGGGGTDGIRLSWWYRNNAPVTTSVTVTSSRLRSFAVRVFEIVGISGAAVPLDRSTITGVLAGADDDTPDSGATAVTTQASEYWLAVVANRNSTITQSGFSSGWTKLFDDVTPGTATLSILGLTFNLGTVVEPTERVRMVTLEQVTSATAAGRITSRMSKSDDWVAGVACFKDATAGPVALTGGGPAVTIAGTGELTAFTPLTSTAPAVTISGIGVLDLFDWQYRLNGLMVGEATIFEVIDHEGLEGFEVRDGDVDLARRDGASRGADYAVSRQPFLELETAGDPAVAAVLGQQAAVQQAVETLMAALSPQETADWDLVWRHPGRPVRKIVCRPTALPRRVDWSATMLARIRVAFRAADPRIYSAAVHSAVLPAAPDTLTVVNAGSADAYPIVTWAGPTSGVTTGVEIVNVTIGVEIDVRTILEAGQKLVADMPARVTAAPRSVITLDGESKFAAWQQPRAAFALAPGENVLRSTVTGGLGVVVTVQWQDTWKS